MKSNPLVLIGISKIQGVSHATLLGVFDSMDKAEKSIKMIRNIEEKIPAWDVSSGLTDIFDDFYINEIPLNYVANVYDMENGDQWMKVE